MSRSLEYSEHTPPAPLDRWVRAIWQLRGPANGRAQPEPVFPDGRMECILNLAHPFQRRIDSRTERQPQVFMMGQITGPLHVGPTGAVDLVGIRFQPWGAMLVHPGPMDELRDGQLPTEALPRWLHTLEERLRNTPDAAHRVALVEAALRAALAGRRSGTDPGRLAAAIDAVGPRSVRALAHGMGLSVRQVERRFRTEVGVGPRTWQRIRRFQGALRLVRDAPDVGLARVALLAGYADQPHLTREFRALAGVTPAEARRALAPLTALFVDDGS